MKKERSTVRRTLHYYTKATLRHWPYLLLGIITTLGYSFFLSFANPMIVGRIVDIVGGGGVRRGEVMSTFGPYIAAFIAANVLGQICSKTQDYSCFKLQIAVYYDLSLKVFDTLSNQSMTFHNNRYGGSLVSQTSKFTNAYNTLIDTFIYAILPIGFSAIFTVVILMPLVPVYVGILIELPILGQMGYFHMTQAHLNEMYAVALFLALMAFYKHKDNIKRLLSGTERKTYLSHKNREGS